MWLMTKHGFYSVVQKQPGIYHIRARERQDLRALTRPAGPVPGEWICAGSGDYPYRLIVGAEEVRRLMAWLADTLDYPNFKAAIGGDPAQQRKPYHQIWALLANALGSYGRFPRPAGLGYHEGRSPLEDVGSEGERDP